MIILKVILWIVVILVLLVLLMLLMVGLALSVKVQTKFDYTEKGTKVKLKYGFFGLNVVDTTKQKKKSGTGKKVLKTLQYHVEPYARAAGNKAKSVAATTLDKKSVESEIKAAENIAIEQDRIAAEEARLNAEMKKANEEVATALNAEKAGIPLPDVVDESRVSKLVEMKNKFDAMDLEGTYNTARSYIDAFDAESIKALLSFIGTQSGLTFGKVGRRFKINDLTIKLNVHGKDAAQTALKCGAIGHVGYPALEKLCEKGKVENCSLTITPDFLATQDKGEFHVAIAFRPLRVMSPFVPYLFKVGKSSISVVSDTTTRISDNKAKYAAEKSEKLKQASYQDATASN